MLKDNFYTIINLQQNENVVNATIELNKEHSIFAGHFPNQPIVPGACEMQIVKEILSSVIQKKIQLLHADDIKFLQMIDPNLNNILNVEIHYSISAQHKIDVKSTIHQKDKICFKLNAAFTFSESD